MLKQSLWISTAIVCLLPCGAYAANGGATYSNEPQIPQDAPVKPAVDDNKGFEDYNTVYERQKQAIQNQQNEMLGIRAPEDATGADAAEESDKPRQPTQEDYDKGRFTYEDGDSGEPEAAPVPYEEPVRAPETPTSAY